MIDTKRIREIADELEIHMMQQALKAVKPNAIESKHYPRNVPNDPLKPFVDYLLKEKVGDRLIDRIALECKNWRVIPTDEEFKDWFLGRFKNCPTYVLKIIIGHVNFKDEQLKALQKNQIKYFDIGYQILPEHNEEKKQEYLKELSSVIAKIILMQTGKFREDCVSNAKIKIIDDEISIEWADGLAPKPLRLTSKKKILNRSSKGWWISGFQKIGPRPLDLIDWIAIDLNGTYTYYLTTPKSWDACSDEIKLEEWLPERKVDVMSFDERLNRLRKMATREEYSEHSREIYDLANKLEVIDIEWLEYLQRLKGFGFDTEKEGIFKFFKFVQWTSRIKHVTISTK